MTAITFRPMGLWPGVWTPERQREGHRFQVKWPTVLDHLAAEVKHLGGTEVVVELGVTRDDLHLDYSALRAGRTPNHPGVIVSFDSRRGPLRYWTDRFTSNWNHQLPAWQANVRAVALTLEALRAVDRYGTAERGEQYTGWAALPSADAGATDAQALLLAEGGQLAHYVTWPNDTDAQRTIYRAAMRMAHPDHGGNTERLLAVRRAAAYLGLVVPMALGGERRR